MEIRTRFAPSPTGFLHIGGARTALFTWLYTRRFGGKFVLRIEDTDIERSTADSVQAILEGVEWLGLDYDEGPFYQLDRLDRYKEVIDQLLAEGKAYRCYCSKERLEDLREKQLTSKEKPRYDGLCRANEPNNPNQPYVIRFKNPREGTVSYEDMLHGTITFQNSELDDLVIARSDGTPTYNLTVVVDDMDMGITHVTRGSDHINNTPRQINILKAIGGKTPIYAHVPMLLGDDGKKLSKRHGALSVMKYRDYGYLPEAMRNHLVRLGWSHGDQEILTLEEMIKYFDIKNVNKAATEFNITKLQWFNQQYMKSLPAKHVAQSLEWQMDNLEIEITEGPALAKVVEAQAERCHTLQEMAEKSRYFYEDFSAYDEKALKHLKAENADILKEAKETLEKLEKWQATEIHEKIIEISEKNGLKLGKVAQPIRVAVTGGTISPPIDITIELIGKEKTLARLETAINKCLTA